MHMKTLTVIGGGAGSADSLTGKACAVIAASQRIYTTQRLGELIQTINPAVQIAPYHKIRELLEADITEDAAVVVSGDTGFFSLAKQLKHQLGQLYSLRMLPGLSSMQMLCARLGISYENLKVVSTHGRTTSALGPVSYHSKVLVLTGGGEDAAQILQSLCACGLEDIKVCAGQNLGLPEERISTGTAASLRNERFASLTVLLLQNDRPALLTERLRDQDFVRGSVPMTKEAVRVLAVDRLEVAGNDIIYDIGAGTGSVSVALARRASGGMVYAVEQRVEGCELIRQNQRKMGTYNLSVIQGTAPEALRELPAPDKVFIGGSGGHMAAILEALLPKADFTVCITAITLESVSEGMAVLTQKGFQDIEVECINISKSKQVGGYHMMMAQNPVYLISGRWERSRH